MANREIIGEGDIAIGADLSEFDKAMAEVPKKTARTAQSAVSAWASAAKKLNENLLVSQAESVSAIFIQMGGSVSQAATVITSLIRPVATAAMVLEPLTLAAGGTALAFVGLGVAAVKGAGAAVAAAYDLADASVEALASLKKAGEEARLPPDTVESIQLYEESWTQLELTIDKTTAILGGDLAEGLLLVNKLLSDGLDWVTDNEAAWDAFWATLTSNQSIAIGLLAELTKGQREQIEATLEQERVQRKLQKEIDEMTSSITATIEVTESEVEIRRRAAEEARRQKEMLDDMLATAKQVSAQAKLDEERLNEERLQAWNRGWLDTEATIANVNREMEEMERLGEQAIDTINRNTEAWQEQRDKVLETLGYIQQYTAMLTGAVTTVLQIEADFAADRASDAMDALDRLRDRERDLYGELNDLRIELKEETRKDAAERKQAEIDALQAEIDALDAKESHRAKLARQAAGDARHAFLAERKAAIAEIELNGLIAVITAFAQLGPIAGLAAGFAIEAATQAAALQAASVPIPEFPTGMSPDHFPVAVQRGEPILSRPGNKRLEDALGPGAADRLNHGMSVGGRVTYLQVGRRVVAAMLEEAGVVRQVDPRTVGKRGRRR